MALLPTHRLYRTAASARTCRGQGQNEESSGVFIGSYCGMTGPKCPVWPKAVEDGLWVLDPWITPGLQPSTFMAEVEPLSDHPHPQEWPRVGTPLRQPGGHQGTVPAQRALSHGGCRTQSMPSQFPLRLLHQVRHSLSILTQLREPVGPTPVPPAFYIFSIPLTKGRRRSGTSSKNALP